MTVARIWPAATFVAGLGRQGDHAVDGAVSVFHLHRLHHDDRFAGGDGSAVCGRTATTVPGIGLTRSPACAPAALVEDRAGQVNRQVPGTPEIHQAPSTSAADHDRLHTVDNQARNPCANS